MLIAPALVADGYANIDVIGVGASAFDLAKGQGLNVQSINWAERSEATDKRGKLRFVNKSAEQCWHSREALDPDSGENLVLPHGSELLADLCALRWRMQVNGIKIEPKNEIKARIGPSPDCGDAVILALPPNLRFFQI